MITDAKDKREKHRQIVRESQRVARAGKREIGAIPSCVNPERREATRHDFRLFCRTYLGTIFTLPWSENHNLAASRIEAATVKGKRFAFAMPRASGKTCLCDAAALWTTLHAHCHFVALIGASEQMAEDRLAVIKTQFMVRDLLLEDFPEVVYPVRCLETAWRQAEYQTSLERPTMMTWKTKKMVFPTCYDENGAMFATSGSVLKVSGITGALRGMNHAKRDGTVIRPDLAICDDPQTRESAQSPSQSATRARILAADVAYLSGPGEPISVIVPCTVICEDDMADRILDRDRHPEYQGIRTQMVESFPTNEKLWEEYEDILKDSYRNDGDMTPATAFYEQNREEMDEGAKLSWPERFGPDELSALQHAMNLKIHDEEAFWSECQNKPIEGTGDEEIMATPAEVLAKITDFARFTCPKDSTVVTTFIDIQKTVLYYVTAAWSPGFTGQIIDYNTWPEQSRRHFATSEIRKTFESEVPGAQLEGQIYHSLRALVSRLVTSNYSVDGGGELANQIVLIDANWGQFTNTVYQFCQEFRTGARVVPCHGRYVGASSQPWSHWKRKRGETVGPHWRIRPSEEWPIQHAIFDTNFWKTFTHQRMKANFGETGTLCIYGRQINQKRLDTRHHADFADQFCAEFAVKCESQGRTVHEWKSRSNRPDNHLLDCSVGAAVGASMCGIELAGSKTPTPDKPRRTRRLKKKYLENSKKW